MDLAALCRVAEVPREQLDEEVKLWAGDVRELSYDMEDDVVDDLLVRVNGPNTDTDMDVFEEIVGKMKSLFKKGKARRQIATAVNDIKEQIQDVAARHERYFIVIDDIWDVNAWKSIKFALMGGKCGSKIITTTRNMSVSKECCSSNHDMVYKMKPLSDVDSQRLFYNRIFPRDNICPPELEQVSRDILKKCDGVPLAIVTLSSHLASNQQIKQKSQWYVLLNSIGNGLTRGDTNLEEMRRILSFSYYDLPSHLKTCLLYLSIFPEDYHISRDRLIRRWICEGFIQGDNLFEVGESYFNELINRSMIEPIDIDVEGRAKYCRVHDMMLDLICDLSSEENFVTILDVIKGDKPLERKIRRLSLQKNMTECTNTLLTTTNIMSQVRSFTLFSPAINQMFSLSRFKVLRVLDLENCFFVLKSGYPNLACLGYLIHLRYLGLNGTAIPPEILIEIGKLQSLEILDLRGFKVVELPASFCYLRNLVCLYLKYRAIVPVGIRNLTSLEELTGVGFTKDNVEALRNLTQLRVLSCGWLSSGCPLEELVIFVELLGKLHKLESLEIIARGDKVDVDPMRANWVLPPQLRRLRLRHLEFQILPTWISSSSLPSLSYLDWT